MTIKKVLVSGGFGYVGSRLTPFLLESGYAVRVIDLCLYGDDGLKALQKNPKFGEWEGRFEFLRLDIRNPEHLATACKEIDAVIHLAAISNDPTGQINETLTKQVNFDAVGAFLSAARKAGVKRFINASSSSVYGIKNEQNVTEALEPEPLTYYSKYKMLSEWLVLAASSPDFVTVNLRPATICGYSPRQRLDLTVNKLSADAVRKGLITVHGGDQRRPNVGMTDVITIYRELLKADAAKINGQTFNFGFENLKVIDIAKLIQKELGDLKPRIQVTDTTDNRDYHISSQKISSVLGYKPVSSIAQEVENLRRVLETNEFGDIEDAKFYNMKSMKIELSRAAYDLFK